VHLVHIYLANEGHWEFNRVFNGDDVPMMIAERLEHGVDRSCLASTGWSGHQHESLAALDAEHAGEDTGRGAG
jgi:hypothetical protein